MSCLVLSTLRPRLERAASCWRGPRRAPLSRQLHAREAAAELGELLEGDGEVLGEQLLVLGVDLVRVRVRVRGRGGGRGRGRS